MARFQGIAQIAFYDSDASVLFDRLDADATELNIGQFVKGETDATGGRVHSGEMCELTGQGLDPDGSLLIALREWYRGNNRISMVGLSPDNGTFYNWLESDRLSEVQPVRVTGRMRGRADFVRFAMKRMSEEPEVYAQVNLASHLATALSNMTVNVSFPIPGIPLYFGVDGTGSGRMRVQFRNADGDLIGSNMDVSLTSGRAQRMLTTPAGIHTIRIITNDTASNLSIRGDGSYVYSAS